MRTDTRPIQITIADLQADPEGIIRDLTELGEAIIVSTDGKMIATLAPIAYYPSLMPEQIIEIKRAFAEAEKEDPSDWIDHDDFMRQIEEDERNRDDA